MYRFETPVSHSASNSFCCVYSAQAQPNLLLLRSPFSGQYRNPTFFIPQQCSAPKNYSSVPAQAGSNTARKHSGRILLSYVVLPLESKDNFQ